MSSSNFHSEECPAEDADKLFHLSVELSQTATTVSEKFRVKDAFFCLNSSDSPPHLLNVLNKHCQALVK